MADDRGHGDPGAGSILIDKAGIEGSAAKVVWLILALYVAYWAIRILLNWYRYHNDIWVITNQRIIDSTKRHPFDLRISTADLVNIQDMSVERSGILKTILDYGDILCQTAAEMQSSAFPAYRTPARCKLWLTKSETASACAHPRENHARSL